MASIASSKSKKPSVSAAAIPALGGRLFVVIAILAGMALLQSPLAEKPADALMKAMKWEDEKAVDMTQWRAGEVQDIKITLVTADYDKLACALDKEVEGTHCEYKTETTPWPKDPNAPVDNNKKDIIQPYSAVPDNALVLIAGLWAQPEVAMRLHAEPPETAPAKKLARFIAHCKVRPIERVDNVSIRWNKEDKWARGLLRTETDQQVPPWIAVTESCAVEDELIP